MIQRSCPCRRGGSNVCGVWDELPRHGIVGRQFMKTGLASAEAGASAPVREVSGGNNGIPLPHSPASYLSPHMGPDRGAGGLLARCEVSRGQTVANGHRGGILVASTY